MRLILRAIFPAKKWLALSGHWETERMGRSSAEAFGFPVQADSGWRSILILKEKNRQTAPCRKA